MKQPFPCLLTLGLCAVLVGCGDQGALEPPMLERALEDERVAVTDTSTATGTETGQLVPLRRHFEGGGADFSGTLTHLGRFEGVFDAVTNTAVWWAADGDTLTNQTTSFVLGEQVSSGVFRYAQS